MDKKSFKKGDNIVLRIMLRGEDLHTIGLKEKDTVQVR